MWTNLSHYYWSNCTRSRSVVVVTCTMGGMNDWSKVYRHMTWPGDLGTTSVVAADAVASGTITACEVGRRCSLFKRWTLGANGAGTWRPCHPTFFCRMAPVPCYTFMYRGTGDNLHKSVSWRRHQVFTLLAPLAPSVSCLFSWRL